MSAQEKTTIEFRGDTFVLDLNARAMRLFGERTGTDFIETASGLFEYFTKDDAGPLPLKSGQIAALAYCLLQSKTSNPQLAYEDFEEDFGVGEIALFVDKMKDVLEAGMKSLSKNPTIAAAMSEAANRSTGADSGASAERNSD